MFSIAEEGVGVLAAFSYTKRRCTRRVKEGIVSSKSYFQIFRWPSYTESTDYPMALVVDLRPANQGLSRIRNIPGAGAKMPKACICIVNSPCILMLTRDFLLL
jgi:hypothetical protein